MSHPYKKDADAGHARKLKAYGGQSGNAPLTHAGFPALNTDQQAGRAPLNSDKYIPPETTPRVMRKKGGRVAGADSLKRLDKAPRKGSKSAAHPTGARKEQVPMSATEQVDFDPTIKFAPGEMNETSVRKRGGKVGGHQQDYTSRSHESQGSQGMRPREGHKKGGSAYHEGHINKGEKYGAARTSGETKGELDSAMRALKYGNKKKAEKELGRAQGHTRKTEYYTGRAEGGKAEHDDEAMDRKLVKKMVKGEALTGKKDGGRTRRASGGGAFSDYMGESGERHESKGGKKGAGKTTVNIMIGGQQPQQGQPGMDPMLLAALAGAGGPGAGAPPPPPPSPPPGAAPPPAAMAGPMPPAPMGGAPQLPPGGMPMPRKDGGKVQVPYKKPGRKDDYPAMDFGSGGGFGRKQKIDAYGTKGPTSKNNY